MLNFSRLYKEDLQKRDFTEAQRHVAAEKGYAMPGGTFPIETADDVENAVSLYGVASDKGAVKAHIINQAKRLGAENKLPADWQGSTKKP